MVISMEIFNKLNESLSSTATYISGSTFDNSCYFKYQSHKYSLGVFGDISIITNITNGNYVKLKVTETLVNDLIQCLESSLVSPQNT